MRAFLDRLYLLSGGLACICLALMGLSIVGQVAGRFARVAFDATEVSGFFMAASLFLGLAYTFRTGSHIRVNLLITRLGPRARRAAELWCSLLASIASAYWTYETAKMTLVSIDLHDISPGLMAVPFWIPQTALVAGTGLFTVACIDEFVRVLRGAELAVEDAEARSLRDIKAVGFTGGPRANPASAAE